MEEEFKLAFKPFLCVKSGYGFKEGFIYPCCGGNDGLQIICENKAGDAQIYIFHAWLNKENKVVIQSPDGDSNGPLFNELVPSFPAK